MILGPNPEPTIKPFDAIKPLDAAREFRDKGSFESGSIREITRQASATPPVPARPPAPSEGGDGGFRRRPVFDSYANFDLRLIRARSNKLIVEASGPAGEAVDRIGWPAKLKKEMGAVLTTGSTRDLLPRADNKAASKPGKLQDLCRKIGEILMPANVKVIYERSKDEQKHQSSAKGEQKGLRIRLFIYDPDVADIPWEAALIGKDYVSLRLQTPMVRYVLANSKPDPLVVPRPIKVLLLIGHPQAGSPLEVDKEREFLERALEGLIRNKELSVDYLEDADLNRLRTKAQEGFHILHYIGHGTYDDKQAQGAIYIGDPKSKSIRVTADDLVRNLQDAKQEQQVRFIFLNACDTAHAAGGLAEQLVRDMVPAALGMRRPVLDQVAIEFARKFYTSLASGWPIDAALVEGRNAVANFPGQERECWNLPILYMRAPDGKIFL